MTCGKGPYAAPGLETNPSGHAEICENGIYFDVDYINGQKTGYFLDQKYNRAAAGRLAHGRRVLDCFTHTGAFALHCAAGGAESVTAVDVSASALEQARRNAERNGLEGRMEFRQADVFELLTELGKSGEKALGLHHPRPARLYEKRRDGRKRAARLPGDQPPRHADIAAGRVSGNVLVLALYDRHAFPRHAGGRGARRERTAPPDRGAAAESRPPDPLGRAGDGLSEILSLPDRINAEGLKTAEK